MLAALVALTFAAAPSCTLETRSFDTRVVVTNARGIPALEVLATIGDPVLIRFEPKGRRTIKVSLGGATVEGVVAADSPLSWRSAREIRMNDLVRVPKNASLVDSPSWAFGDPGVLDPKGKPLKLTTLSCEDIEIGSATSPTDDGPQREEAMFVGKGALRLAAAPGGAVEVLVKSLKPNGILIERDGKFARVRLSRGPFEITGWLAADRVTTDIPTEPAPVLNGTGRGFTQGTPQLKCSTEVTLMLDGVPLGTLDPGVSFFVVSEGGERLPLLDGLWPLDGHVLSIRKADLTNCR